MAPSAATSTTPSGEVRVAEEDEPIVRPEADIGEFDCRALTAVITVDNTDSDKPVPFAVDVLSWVPPQQYSESFYNADFSLEARTQRTLSVPLADNAYNRVSVRDAGNGVVAERIGSCGNLNLDPRATIAAFDCGALTTTATLDNSRSTVPLTFNVSADAWGPFSPESTPLLQDVRVDAGKIMVLTVPLVRDARTEVTVAMDEPILSVLDQRAESCGDTMTATIEPRCGTKTAIVTLDNRHSTQPAKVVITSVAFDFEDTASTNVVIAAGRSKVVTVPVRDNAYNAVDATVTPGGYVLAIEDFTCGRILYEPRASFGPVNCRNRTVPLTLDNSRSSSWASYVVSDARDETWLSQGDAIPAGATKTIIVRIPSGMPGLRVLEYSEEGGGSYLDSVDTRCLAVSPEATGVVAATPPSELASSGADVIGPVLLALALSGGGGLLLWVRRQWT